MDIIQRIVKVKQKLGITDTFHCIDSNFPTNEAEYNAKIKWIIGEDENCSAIYGDTQLITWQQLQEHSDEAIINIKLDLVRIERNTRLKETDWWACSDRVMTEPQKAYRQALRDITNNCNPELDEVGNLVLTSVNWPTKP